MKEISIIIATINASKTIKRCLDSIIIQKEPSVEIIIIDGLSTDSTEEIVQTYGNEIDIFISESDLGIYDAWNKGISVSSGNWIMFVGADDILLPNSIKEIFQFISLNNVNEIDYISAKKYFDVSLNLFPFNYNNLLMSAWTNYFLGNKNEASVLFNKTLLCSPNDKSDLEGLSLIK